jgi:hypothetical protein
MRITTQGNFRANDAAFAQLKVGNAVTRLGLNGFLDRDVHQILWPPPAPWGCPSLRQGRC